MKELKTVIMTMTSMVLFLILSYYSNGNHLQENLTMFWLYKLYVGIKLLKYFYILAIGPKIYCRILAF
jgi:hypothetical protein